MPLIDDALIESLREPHGFSRFSLYLLGAVPLSHRAYNPCAPLPPESEWRPRVICSRISGRRLHAIRHQAEWLKRPYKASRDYRRRSPERDADKRMRAKLRRMVARFKRLCEALERELATH